jgi:hypothetical protein
MEINVSWTDIKAFVTARTVPLQYYQSTNAYYLYATDGPFGMTCQIPTDGSDSSDQTDFETNYKTAANSSIRPNMVQVLGADSLTLCPFGALLAPAANTLTNCDIPLPATMVLRGAQLFSSNAMIGDWFSLQVIDKDDVTGQGGTPDVPTILGTYLISWYVMPGVVNAVEDVSISQQLPQGVYVRVVYTSVGTTAPNVLLNFISYTGTP